MNIVVLDSSVIIKWVKARNEDDVDKALIYYKQFQNKQIQVTLPDLIFYETSNMASRDFPENRALWEEMILNLFSETIKIVPPDKKLVEDITRLTKAFRITAYDASYIAVAERFNTKLVTADKKLIAAAPDLTISL